MTLGRSLRYLFEVPHPHSNGTKAKALLYGVGETRRAGFPMKVIAGSGKAISILESGSDRSERSDAAFCLLRIRTSRQEF